MPPRLRALFGVCIGAFVSVASTSGAHACADAACTVFARVTVKRAENQDLRNDMDFQITGLDQQNMSILPPTDVSLNMATKHFEGVIAQSADSFVVSFLTSSAYSTSFRRYYVSKKTSNRSEIKIKVAERNSIFDDDMNLADQLDAAESVLLLRRIIRSQLPQTTGQAFRARKRLAEVHSNLGQFSETRRELVEILTRLRFQDLTKGQRNDVFSLWLDSFFKQFNYMSAGNPMDRFSRKLCEPVNQQAFVDWQEFVSAADLPDGAGGANASDCNAAKIADQALQAQGRYHKAAAS